MGAGRLGRTLALALRRAGVTVRLVAWRSAERSLRRPADIVLLATRDQDIERAAARVTAALHPLVVLHCAGARGPEALLAAKRTGVAVGQMHPLVAVASHRRPPELGGTWVHVCGDRAAVTAGRRLAKLLGMRAFRVPSLSFELYHAAAVMLAGGAIALIEAAADLMAQAGVPPPRARLLLAPLLRSVAQNARELPLPDALTGPARRADFEALERQGKLLRKHAPEHLTLGLELLRRQARIARRLAVRAGEDSGRSKARSGKGRPPTPRRD